MDQLDIPYKAYAPEDATIHIQLGDRFPVGNALKILGYTASCKVEFGKISIQKPPRHPRKTHRERSFAPIVMVDNQNKRKVYGRPRLYTSDRTRLMKTNPDPPRHFTTSEELQSIVTRLSAPRKSRVPMTIVEDDSPRIGFRITMVKRNPQLQQLYMERLSVPRIIACAEPTFFRVENRRYFTEKQMWEHVIRLSQPRSLESLIVRYKLPVEQSIASCDDATEQDAPLTMIASEPRAEKSPYQGVVANLMSPRHIDTSASLVTEVRFLCHNILNIVTKGEEEFPGRIDGLAAQFFETTVLPGMESRPLRREIHELPAAITSDDSSQTIKLIELVNLLTPSRLLVGRLESLMETLIKHILTLYGQG